MIFDLVYRLLIYMPLHAIYYQGPTMLGFWGGASREDICFLLTGTSSVFWTLHMDECLHLTEQRFQAFVTTILFVLYTCTWIRVVNILTFHVTVTQPILREIRKMRETTITQICGQIHE